MKKSYALVGLPLCPHKLTYMPQSNCRYNLPLGLELSFDGLCAQSKSFCRSHKLTPECCPWWFGQDLNTLFQWWIFWASHEKHHTGIWYWSCASVSGRASALASHCNLPPKTLASHLSTTGVQKLWSKSLAHVSCAWPSPVAASQ